MIAPENLNQYESIVGSKTIDRIHQKAKGLSDRHVVHISSTYYGGGVASMLDPLSVLMNRVGLKAEWRIIQGAPDFFSITKKMHNALQGGKINLTELKMSIYEKVIEKNAIRTHMDSADFVITHDPQPLAMIRHYKKSCPWIWQCHLDLSQPNADIWSYLLQFIDEYDTVIFSAEDYRQKIKAPQIFFFPAIDPLSITNLELDDDEIKERLEHYQIPDDLPLIAQISRFDRWKDPEGVIQAFKIARKKIDCTLVLVGNIATDDPEGQIVYESLMKNKEERIIILSVEDTALVNALQRRAAVILQKSIREGFGLTVAEAMYKGTAVIGGNVGGIRYQIRNGINGFLVSTVDETAERIVQLLQDKKLRQKIGKEARKTVIENFLITRLLEQYLDLFHSFK